MKEISPINFSKLSRLISCNYIIDVREQSEFDEYHINNSINIPVRLICEYPSKYINKHTRYYIICRNGNKSKYVVNILSQLGYDVINVIGGINKMDNSNNVIYYY